MKGNQTKYGKILKENYLKELCKYHLSNSPKIVACLQAKKLAFMSFQIKWSHHDKAYENRVNGTHT